MKVVHYARDDENNKFFYMARYQDYRFAAREEDDILAIKQADEVLLHVPLPELCKFYEKTKALKECKHGNYPLMCILKKTDGWRGIFGKDVIKWEFNTPLGKRPNLDIDKPPEVDMEKLKEDIFNCLKIME